MSDSSDSSDSSGASMEVNIHREPSRNNKYDSMNETEIERELDHSKDMLRATEGAFEAGRYHEATCGGDMYSDIYESKTGKPFEYP